MPQPYPQNVPVEISVGPDAFVRHPLIAALGMGVVSSSAQMETRQAMLVHTLIGGDVSSALTILSVIHNNKIKLEALKALATEKLEGENLLIFKAVMGMCETADKHRNKLAHHMWGWSKHIPESVLLVDPRKFLEVTTLQTRWKAENSLTHAKTVQLGELMRGCAVVYTQEDMRKIRKIIDHTIGVIGFLDLMIAQINGAEVTGEPRKALLGMPEIQESLARHAQRQNGS